MKFLRRHETDEEIDLLIEGEQAHSWWVDRDEITIVPSPKPRGRQAGRRPPAKPKLSGFEQYNSTESLYKAHAPLSSSLQRAFLVLGVEQTTDWKKISFAYRNQAKQCHPDLLDGDDRRMVELNQAYALLRRAYGK